MTIIEKRFVPTDGSRLSKKDAEIVGPLLVQLTEAKGGKVTAEDILEIAKDASSPLHKFFQWDDRKAALQFRLQQARQLISSIKVVVEDGGKEIVTKAFHNVSEVSDADESGATEKTRGYVYYSRGLRDEITRDRILENARRELENWRARYSEYSELAHIFAAIDSVGNAAELELAVPA